MTQKTVLTLLLFLATAFSSFAQNIVISGTVHLERDDTAVALANVIIQDMDGNKVLGYGVTGEDGRFRISLTTENRMLQLVVTGFNIERKTIKIENKSQDISLSVEYKEMALKESRIKTNPIKSDGDTTSYYVSMFADSLDRSIGDVLRKMPAMSVDKNGAIRYQGVPIDYFYVEGMDLMGNRYGIATNNIRAQDIAVVEVYENHQPIKILQNARAGLEGSGKVAVNLKLKQKAKGAFIGSVEAGAGYSPLMFEGEFVGMFFTEKFQTLSSMKTNNSGKDITSELEEQFDGLKWMYPIPGVYSPEIPDINQERFMDNATFASSLNNLFKIGDDKILSVNGVYFHDSQAYKDASTTRYYLPSSNPIEIKETTGKNCKTDNAEVRLKYTDNNSRHYLTAVLSAGMEWNRSNGEVLTDGALISQDFKMLANKSISNHFNYSVSAGRDKWFGVKTEIGYNDLPAELTINPAIYPEIFGYNQLTGVSAVQSYSAQRFNASVLPNISMTIARRWLLRVEAGPTYYSQHMKSLLGLDGAEFVEDRFRNDNDYQRWDIKAGAGLSYRRNSFQMGLSTDLCYSTLDLTDNVRNQNDSKSGLFVRPNFFLMCSIASGLKLELLSYYNEDFAAFENNYAGYIMTDYRRISSRDGVLAENKDHRHSLTLKYSEPLSGFFASGNVQYWGRWANIMYGTEFIGNLSNIQSYAIDNESNGYTFAGKISKYFDAVSSTLDLGVGFNEYWMTVLRQGVLINTDTRAPSVNFVCISNIGKKIKTKYDLTYSHSETIYDDSSRPSPIDALHQKLSVEYQIVPRIIFKLSGEHYFNSAVASGSRHIPFLDSSILYRTNKCDITLEARNILNTTDYSYSLISEATEFESNYRLRQMSIMLKVRFNIH